MTLRELALFAGAGGGILGGRLLGWRTVCAVESDPYCCDVLAQRQNDGTLEPFPIWQGDIRDFDGRPWAGVTDVVSGGFPCTDISTSGHKAGIDGKESGLWKEMARVIREVDHPGLHVFVENSAALAYRGLGTVLGDLASMGFAAEWGVLGNEDAGIPMRRDRLWIVATRDQGRSRGQGISRQTERELLARAAGPNHNIPRPSDPVSRDGTHPPRICGASNGLAYRRERIGALGNGQCSPVAALAWQTLIERLMSSPEETEEPSK